MRLALVRHGRTVWNHERRMQGRSDVPLDDVGRSQAWAVAGLVAETGCSRIITSPLLRALETAEIISRSLASYARQKSATSAEVDGRLVERDYGLAEGLPVDEVATRWPAQDFPAAESQRAVVERTLAVFKELEADGRPTTVVAHGTLIRLAVTALTGTPCSRVLNGEALLCETSARFTVLARLSP